LIIKKLKAKEPWKTVKGKGERMKGREGK
jgi:hypothetical protein